MTAPVIEAPAPAEHLATTERMLLWKSEGIVAETATSAADILHQADLDWDVKMAPLYVDGPNGEKITDAKRRAIVRADTHEVLGVARSRYVPASNLEILQVCDQIFDAGCRYEAAWSWRGGETVGVAMQLPDEVNIAGIDKYGIHLLVKTSHDGGGSVIFAATPVRLACTNMVTAALRGATRTFRATHTASLDGRIAEARTALDITYSYAAAWDEAVKELLDSTIAKDKVAEVAEEIYGEKHVEPVIDLWVSADNIADFRTTRYGAYNALTEYGQWIRPRNPHLESAMRGGISRQSDRAYQLLAV